MSSAESGASNEVHLRLKHGEWEVEITCSEQKVRDVVEKVLSTIDSAARWQDSTLADQVRSLRGEFAALKEAITHAPRSAGIGAERVQKAARSNMTCRGLLDSLWIEEYLVQERALAEVHEELARRGYNYDKTAVAHALADMVREGILTRNGSMRNFRYIQKRPANSISE